MMDLFGVFGFGVKTIMDFFEVGIGNVGIDLGGRNVGMPKHSLNRAEIGAIHEEVGSKTVTKCMRRNVFCNSREFSIFLDDALDRA